MMCEEWREQRNKVNGGNVSNDYVRRAEAENKVAHGVAAT